MLKTIIIHNGVETRLDWIVVIHQHQSQKQSDVLMCTHSHDCGSKRPESSRNAQQCTLGCGKYSSRESKCFNMLTHLDGSTQQSCNHQMVSFDRND